MDMRKLVGVTSRACGRRRASCRSRLKHVQGLANSTLSDPERGRRNPTVITLYELAKALGVSHVELVKFDAKDR